MPRFKIGERVALTNHLRKVLKKEAIGTVVSIVPDRHGMDVFDEYEITFEDSRQLLRFRRFRLTHVGLTNDRKPERAASLGSQCETDLGC